MSALLAALAWGGVVLVGWRPAPRWGGTPWAGAGRDRAGPGGSRGDGGTGGEGAPSGPVARVLLCLAAGACVGPLVGGGAASAVGWGAVVAAGAWWVLRRGPAVAQRRRDRAVAADLPFLVLLLAAGLRSGASAGAALRLAQEAHPGPAADRLRPLTARLAWGVDPVEVWDDLAGDPALGSLGRRLARSHRTGASVAAAVAELAEELAARRRGDVEDLARGVGVRAALPLGLCLLPAFLLLGIVPVVAGLVGQVGWE